MIHLPCSGLFKISRTSLRLVASDDSRHLFLKILLFSVLRSSVVFFTLSWGLAAVVMENLDQKTAIAQTPASSQQTPVGEKTISQVQTLFVNPSVGDDKTGDGSDRTPFKTITQALQAAKGNTVISLSKGTYSQETGESFPLILHPGITIQGDPSTKGKAIIIQGGNDYLSRSYGRQNITIVGADKSALLGVTITNPNPRGYGMWIESSNPTVSENMFIGSTQDGVSINGNSKAIISKNYFYRNGANGMTISGHASPEVRENTFEQTGFGINVAQSAEPSIISNQIQYNRAGIIVQANARPILRSNLIQGNREDGLVAIAQSMPDLGTATEAGGNEFRNNTRYDINASANKQVFSAYGNIIKNDASRIAGKVQIGDSSSTPIAQTTQPSREVTASKNEIIFSAPNLTNNTPKTLVREITPNISPPALQSSIAAPQAIIPSPPPSTFSNSQTAITNRWQSSATGELPQINYMKISPGTVEFTAPQSSNLAAVQRGNLPSTANNMPPLAYIGNQTSVKLRYRIIVPAGNQRDEEIIRFLSPTAFRTVWKGQEVFQVGAFSNTFNAEQMLRILSNNGLKGVMESSN